MNEVKVGHLIYPTGYVKRSTDHVGISIVSEGDVKAAELFLKYRQGRISLIDYANFKEAVDNFTRLFGPGLAWVESQRWNKNIDRMKAEFIQDTLEYIVSGKRRMHVRSWLALVDEQIKGEVSPIFMKGAPVHPGIVIPQQLCGNRASTVLVSWLSHNDGLADLIESTNIMYGGVPYTS